MAYSDDVLALSPVLYWEISESADTATDLSPNGNNGTFSGPYVGYRAPLNGGVTTLGPERVLTSGALNANLAGSSFSVSIVTQMVDSYNYILFDLSGASPWFSFSPRGGYNNYTEILKVDGARTTAPDSGQLYPEETWDHFVITVDATNDVVTIYQNGVEKHSVPATVGTLPADALLTVHQNPHNPDYTYTKDYPQHSAEIAVFDGVLSSTDAANLYASLVVDPWEVAFKPQPRIVAPLGGIPEQNLATGHRVLEHLKVGRTHSQDMLQRGNGTISGTVTDENGNPLARRVRVFERKTARFVAETWSDDAGAYAFTTLDPAKFYTVLAYDYTGENNAVVADWAKPEVPA